MAVEGEVGVVVEEATEEGAAAEGAAVSREVSVSESLEVLAQGASSCADRLGFEDELSSSSSSSESTGSFKGS